MKPAAFQYVAPTSLQDALLLLSQHGHDAKVLAGGQSLVPTMNFRLASYEYLIDINRIPELSFIRLDGGTLRIGAMTRQRAIETSPVVWRHAPLLAEATRSIAHLPIRTRGTIGGSISHADPAAEYPAIMFALDGAMVIQSQSGIRTVPAAEFFKGPLTTILQPDELLVEVQIPVHDPARGFSFDEVSRRVGDFAIIGMAAAISLKQERFSAVRLAACGLDNGATRLHDAESQLEGQIPSPELIGAVARAASASVTPQSDLHADSDYRRHLIAVLLPRVVHRAVGRVMENIHE